MSKIQEALEKIKAEREKQVSDTTPIIGDVLPLEKELDNSRAETISVANDIAGMRQPVELNSEEKADKKIVDAAMSDRYVFNAFRELRTTVVQKINESSPIIMVTSCTYGGGGSFVSLNLAAAIAMDETKTSLLVDCNLAEPNFSNLPAADDSSRGLKDYLKGNECGVGDIIYPTGIPRLRVIPAGQTHVPMTEYFTSVRLHKLFDDIKQRYSQRYIIVDAPPISENADTRILAETCDYVILVVPYGKVTEEQVLKAARAIGKDKLLGTVFNNEPRFPRFAWR